MISGRAWTATHTDIGRGKNRTKKQNLQPSPDGEGRRSGRGAPTSPHLASPLPGGKVFRSKHPGRCRPRDLTSPHRSRLLSPRTPARRTAQTELLWCSFWPCFRRPTAQSRTSLRSRTQDFCPLDITGPPQGGGGRIAALLVPAPRRWLPAGHLG